jgi:hypothetical protein
VLAHNLQSHDDFLENKTHVSHRETINAFGGKPPFLGTLRRKNVVIGFTVIFVTAILTYLLLISQPSIQANGEGTRFITSTKTGQNCDANATKQVTTIAKQYVTRIAALDLGSACKMTLVSNKRTPQVWLVADTKTLIELSAIEIKDELYWDIPIPSQQQTSREYILIITEDYLDLADLAAFKSYLSRLDENQNASVELLAPFFSVIDVNPQYLSHKLVVSSD